MTKIMPVLMGEVLSLGQSSGKECCYSDLSACLRTTVRLEGALPSSSALVPSPVVRTPRGATSASSKPCLILVFSQFSKASTNWRNASVSLTLHVKNFTWLY